MSLERLMVHDVVVLHAPTVDDGMGNQIKDWPNASRWETKGWVARRTDTTAAAELIAEGREAQVSEWVAYLPQDTPITGLDRLEALGISFEVVGPPNPAHSPRGLHHIEAQLRAVSG